MMSKSIEKLSLSLTILLLMSYLCLNQAMDPPVWPQTFTEAFLQYDSLTQVYVTGTQYYDYKNFRQREDFTLGLYDDLCFDLSSGGQTYCSKIYVNNTLYVNFPEKSLCCKCCTSGQEDCMIQPRDWLKKERFEFNQTEVFDGVKVNKWQHIISTGHYEIYYSTADSKAIPFRHQMHVGSQVLEKRYNMNSYKTNPISDSVFQIPVSCSKPCPSINKCSQGLSKNRKPGNYNKNLHKMFKGSTKLTKMKTHNY